MVAVAPTGPRATHWMASARADQLMLWSWVPFALMALALREPRTVLVGVSAVLAFSFSHQVLTVPLVYGDRATFDSRRVLFVLAPAVLLAGVAVLRVEAFVLLTAVAAGWNAFHTVRQRYGMVRIYGRKVGQDAPGAEQWFLFAAFLTAVVLAAATPALEATLADGSLDLGQAGTNTELVRVLGDLRPVARWVALPGLVLTVVLGLRWWIEERARPQNSAKHWYLASTLLMFAVAPFHPLAALLGFVGSHAVEYYVVVVRSLRSRTTTTPGTFLARSTSAVGPWVLVVGFAAAVGGAVYLALLGPFREAAAVVAMTLGGMHFLFDGIIWRTGRPAYTASSFTTPD